MSLDHILNEDKENMMNHKNNDSLFEHNAMNIHHIYGTPNPKSMGSKKLLPSPNIRNKKKYVFYDKSLQ